MLMEANREDAGGLSQLHQPPTYQHPLCWRYVLQEAHLRECLATHSPIECYRCCTHDTATTFTIVVWVFTSKNTL